MKGPTIVLPPLSHLCVQPNPFKIFLDLFSAKWLSYYYHSPILFKPSSAPITSQDLFLLDMVCDSYSVRSLNRIIYWHLVESPMGEQLKQ